MAAILPQIGFGGKLSLRQAASPKKRLQASTTLLGPNLSDSLPARMPRKPLRRKDKEKAPESTARPQPNSVNIGVRKTPEVKIVPIIAAMITNVEATIT